MRIITITFLLFVTLQSLISMEIKDRWLNGEMDNLEFISNMEERLNSLKKPIEKAETLLLIGQAYFYEEKKEESINYLEQSQGECDKSLKLVESSRAWRIKADAGSLLMIQKGITYIISNSKKVNEMALRALELNPDNYRASLIVAQGLINAPKIFGGDKKKGIEILYGLLDKKDLKKDNRFYITITLARIKESKKLCEEALKIYPGNREAREFLKEFKTGK